MVENASKATQVTSAALKIIDVLFLCLTASFQILGIKDAQINFL